MSCVWTGGAESQVRTIRQQLQQLPGSRDGWCPCGSPSHRWGNTTGSFDCMKPPSLGHAWESCSLTLRLGGCLSRASAAPHSWSKWTLPTHSDAPGKARCPDVTAGSTGAREGFSGHSHHERAESPQEARGQPCRCPGPTGTPASADPTPKEVHVQEF